MNKPKSRVSITGHLSSPEKFARMTGLKIQSETERVVSEFERNVGNGFKVPKQHRDNVARELCDAVGQAQLMSANNTLRETLAMMIGGARNG